MITAAAAKDRCNVCKALWKRMETLYHNVLCAIQERAIIIIISDNNV